MPVQPSSVLAGNVVRFRIRTRNDAGTLVDPTTVTCEYGLDGTAGTPLTVTRTATGDYRADWDTTGIAEEAIYWILAQSTGALVSSREIRIKVRVPHIT